MTTEGTVVRSIRIPASLDAIIRKQNINFSKETVRLWRLKLQGNLSDNATKEHIELNIIKNELTNKINEYKELLSRVESLEAEIKTQEQSKENDEEQKLIKTLKKDWFSDIGDIPEFNAKIGLSREDIIEKRLESFADKHNIPLNQVKTLFTKAFPSFSTS